PPPGRAPDGRRIAFLSDRDGTQQLYRLPMRGGEAEKLTDRKDAVRAFRWSPDGRRIALLMPEPKPDAQQQREKEKDDGRVADKDARHPRVWMLDVESRALKQVTTANWQIDEVEWTPDGTRLIAVADDTPAADTWNERIYSIDLSTGGFASVGDVRRPPGGIPISPAGQTIADGGARGGGPRPRRLPPPPAPR